MHSVVDTLKKDFPELGFISNTSFYWSPGNRSIYYDSTDNSLEAIWKLLHETSHGLLHHESYATDFDLLLLEVAAWQKAAKLGDHYGFSVDEEHIEDCLDSYRDWLHARSTCPTCLANGLQTSKSRYECLNCPTTWQVSRSRFCRAYRRSMTAKQ